MGAAQFHAAVDAVGGPVAAHLVRADVAGRADVGDLHAAVAGLLHDRRVEVGEVLAELRRALEQRQGQGAQHGGLGERRAVGVRAVA
ncbi:hypothetical protein [Streptomyces sp. UNOC14_S4]|uniref:hypothetical protein n=1 Tax=Streptomyces sp. UNOC14_S4 TaxID=2872340 RepID=UPI001E56EBE0|nr:hypothetical protein [Streptomyces sp. UNOC14_S4]MCC3769643.1 hypothetical protein [Streptomyces sp. UNOC14_S4]